MSRLDSIVDGGLIFVFDVSTGEIFNYPGDPVGGRPKGPGRGR